MYLLKRFATKRLKSPLTALVALVGLTTITNLSGCSGAIFTPVTTQSQVEMLPASQVSLMIERAKSKERARVQAEYAKQALTTNVFTNLKKMALPPMAGECLAQVVLPAQYTSTEESVQLSSTVNGTVQTVCETHFTLDNIIKLQAALSETGHLKPEETNEIGDKKEGRRVNGLWDESTQQALLAFQKENQLAHGVDEVVWTLESLKRLNLL